MPSKKFPEKYYLALEQAAKEKPQGGLNGFEQEWNLLGRTASLADRGRGS